MSDQVVLLTSHRPGAVPCYIIDRLLREDLIDAIVFVRPAEWRWKLRQAWRIGRRSGLRGVWQRGAASALRKKLLDPFSREYLDGALFPSRKIHFPPIPAGVKVLQGGTLTSRRTLKLVRALKPALGVQSGAGWVRRPLLDVPRLGILSLHHGMMPLLRGMDCVLWAFLENRPEWIGITLQLINERLDAGRIVARVQIEPEPDENPFSVMARETVIGAELMARGIRDVLAGRAAILDTNGERGIYRSMLPPELVRRAHEIMLTYRVRVPASRVATERVPAEKAFAGAST